MTNDESAGKKRCWGGPVLASAMSLGAGVGVALGAGIGAALGHIALGAGVGVALGAAIGMTLAQTNEA